MEFFTTAAQKGCARSQFAIGVLGNSAQEAVLWFTLAAAQENEQAQCKLAAMYEKGYDGLLEKSSFKALYWSKRAAVGTAYANAHAEFAGHLMRVAIEHYGSCQIVGFSPIPEALFWARKAAGGGSVAGEDMLKSLEEAYSQLCDLCGKPSQPDCKLVRCSRCKAAYYCGRECQRKHWRVGHKADCFCPSVAQG